MNTAFRRNAFIFKANPKDIENDKLPILILVTGQSNSLNSTTPGVTGDGDVQDHPNIWTYEHFPDVDQTQGWKFGFKTSPDYPIDPGVGNAFDYHVAKHLEKTTGRPVLIAKQSAGGQGVAEWLPSGGGIPGATGSMFSSVSAMFEAAIAAPLPFRRDNKSLIDLGISTADYMLWHQGEADADYRPNPARNGEGEYIETFKSVLSVFLNPSINGSSAAPKINENTQIVVGELLIGGNSAGNPTDDRNTDLERIASQIENVSFANCGNLTSTDGLHFDNDQAPRMAQKYIEALSRRSIASEFVSPNEFCIDKSSNTWIFRGLVNVSPSSSVSVTLPKTLVDSGFTVSMDTSTSLEKFPSISGKTSTGFTINNGNSANSAVVRWTVISRVSF